MKVEPLGFEHEARRRVMEVEKRRYQTPPLPAMWSLLQMSYGVAVVKGMSQQLGQSKLESDTRGRESLARTIPMG